ncbi:hypothetical protein [Pimelobacter simplex]|uniref:hypothetical protein n=1 Tax=Nocardioides simplex TaxID=2045 RepID=UPI003AABE1F4
MSIVNLDPRINRRMALGGLAAGGVAAGLAPLSPAGAAEAKRRARAAQRQADRVLVGRVSANGWPMEKGSDIGGRIWTRPLAGTGGEVQLCAGDVEAVLLRVARRFHYEVHPLEAGDVIGFRPTRRSARGGEKNHASGTAIDILPRSFPHGSRDCLSSLQVTAIRDIVRDCDGVVIWGGDALVPAPSHFEIGVRPDDPRLPTLVTRIRREDELPAEDVGVTM